MTTETGRYNQTRGHEVDHEGLRSQALDGWFCAICDDIRNLDDDYWGPVSVHSGSHFCDRCYRPIDDEPHETRERVDGLSTTCQHEHCPVQWKSQTFTREQVLQLTIEGMKADVRDDIKTGILPADVSSFSELHDYVDANEYGGICDDDYPYAPTDEQNVANEAQNAVDAWLAQGGAAR